MFDVVSQIYAEQFTWDVECMSQPWMYYFVLPIMFFLPFFATKWCILTLPFWMPLAIVIQAARGTMHNGNQTKEVEDV